MKTLYSDINVTIIMNSSGEIFVKRTTVNYGSIRISPGFTANSEASFTVTAEYGVITPTAVHGIPAFLIKFPIAK